MAMTCLPQNYLYDSFFTKTIAMSPNKKIGLWQSFEAKTGRKWLIGLSALPAEAYRFTFVCLSIRTFVTSYLNFDDFCTELYLDESRKMFWVDFLKSSSFHFLLPNVIKNGTFLCKIMFFGHFLKRHIIMCYKLTRNLGQLSYINF